MDKDGVIKNLPEFWTAQKLLDEDKSAGHHTFADAKMAKGPMRCWFSRNAHVFFFGCSTGGAAKSEVGIAGDFAEKVLRRGGGAWGMRGKVAISPNDDMLYWGENSSKSSSNPSNGPWEFFDGRQ